MSRATKLRLGTGVLGVIAATAATIATVTSDHEGHKVVTGVFVPLVGLSFVAGGLVAWTRTAVPALRPAGK